MDRRQWLMAATAVALAGVAAPARAGTTDLAASCETALRLAVRAAAAAFARAGGADVRVFPTMPGLIVPQLMREIQNDVVVARAATLDALEQAHLLARRGPRQWRNRWVLAGGADRLTDDARVAVTDPTAASEIDGAAVLARLGVRAKQVIGVVDTATVADLLVSGAADVGLIYTTDLRADPRLKLVAAVPEAAAPAVLHVAAITTLARRPNPAAFLDFLQTDAAGALLAAHGLEAVA